jgi:hypothetical protein
MHLVAAVIGGCVMPAFSFFYTQLLNVCARAFLAYWLNEITINSR